ncbi:MAG: hypothetical protein R3C59_08010 [Planctomycetaceae bacterium]
MIDSIHDWSNNGDMAISGTVRDGVVVPQEGACLPEGATVRLVVVNDAEAADSATSQRVQLPLVKSKTPGTLNLTNERIAEIFDEEDVARHQRLGGTGV